MSSLGCMMARSGTQDFLQEQLLLMNLPSPTRNIFRAPCCHESHLGKFWFTRWSIVRIEESICFFVRNDVASALHDSIPSMDKIYKPPNYNDGKG